MRTSTMAMEAYKSKLVIAQEAFLSKHTVKQFKKWKKKWRVQQQVLKYFAKKVFCGFGGISHVFFGGISQVTHRYLFKDLPRFSEHLFSRTALKCCLRSVIYKCGENCGWFFNFLCLYIEIVLNENCRFFGLEKWFLYFQICFFYFPVWYFTERFCSNLTK